MFKWFKNPQTVEELKKEYRRLSKQHHPDLGGSCEDMQQINSEYAILFDRLKNTHEAANGDVYTDKKVVHETPEEFMNIINKLIIFDDITIELIGRWIWVTGCTYPHREILKELKFYYSKSKKAWW